MLDYYGAERMENYIGVTGVVGLQCILSRHTLIMTSMNLPSDVSEASLGSELPAQNNSASCEIHDRDHYYVKITTSKRQKIRDLGCCWLHAPLPGAGCHKQSPA